VILSRTVPIGGTVIAAIPSAVLVGVDGTQVSVEVHVSNGLPGFTVVGLPDAAVRESRDRVRSALLSSGLQWPLRRVTVNLAPSRFRFGRVTDATSYSPSPGKESPTGTYTSGIPSRRSSVPLRHDG
jgi:hypothetical protein